MKTLENGKLLARISSHGAELTSLFDKVTQQECIWEAAPKHWARHAPVLFPNVGKYYGGSFLHNGTSYSEGQHGFARDMDFECLEHTSEKAKFQLKSNAETLKRYPFPFELEISYKLDENSISVTWKVSNTGSETMYFTIGGHPAFKVPYEEFENYQLYFESKDYLEYKLLDLSSGTIIADSAVKLPLEDSKLRLRKDMFDNDALVFDNGQIEKITILKPDGSKYITLISQDFPNYGIWSKPGAPFVCLEPWVGRADNVGFDGELKTKPGITAVSAGESFEITHSIIVE